MCRGSRTWLSFVLLAAGACKQAEPARAPSETAAPPKAAAPDPAASSSNGLHFIEDDYEAARAEALKRGVPIFVDVWASWCHTCLSMKQYVLPDPSLAKIADAFVWLAIDSERASNRPFLTRFVTRSLPTLWVIEPREQTPLLKWIGAATAEELASVLGELRSAEPGADAPTAAAAPVQAEATALYLRGNRASALGEPDAAIDFYRRALASAPTGFRERPRVLEALSMRLAEQARADECVELAVREAASMPPGTSRVNVLVNALDSVSHLAPDSAARSSLPKLVELSTRVSEDAAPAVLVDDRSNLFASLVEVQKARDPEQHRKLAAAWAGLLESHAQQAPNAAARRVFDPHRVDAYLALGEPAKIIPMLEQSEREVPTDYNPPARLARAYLALSKLPEARAAIDRALARCEGPRKLRLYMLKADILVAAEDRPGARATLQEALTFATTSQLPAQYDKLRQNIERRAQELG